MIREVACWVDSGHSCRPREQGSLTFVCDICEVEQRDPALAFLSPRRDIGTTYYSPSLKINVPILYIDHSAQHVPSPA